MKTEKRHAMRHLMLLSTLLITALFGAVEAKTTDDGLRYQFLTDSTVSVKKAGEGELLSGVVVIPARVTIQGKQYTVTEVSGWGFFGCKNVTEFKLPDTIEKLGYFAFSNCEGIVRAEIPASVRKMDGSALESCFALREVVFHEGITSLGERTLSECSALEQIDLPRSLTEISPSLFSHCANLQRIAVPENVKRIGNYAFADCPKLEEIVLPEGLQSIGKEAFSFCTSLQEINLPSTVSELGDNAFASVPLRTIKIPRAMNEIKGNPVRSCKTLEYIDFSDNPNFKERNGLVYTANDTCLVLVQPKTVLADLVVPAGVKLINPFAFYNNQTLKSIVLPRTLETIGEDAFYCCSQLKKVSLSEGLKYVCRDAFYHCGALEEISLPNSVKEVGANCFNFCKALKRISFYETLLEEPTMMNQQLFLFSENVEQVIVRQKKGSPKIMRVADLTDLSKYYFIDQVLDR